MLKLDVTAEDFPLGAPLSNGEHELELTWDDILWAAITIGRPHLHFVFRHGIQSLYEALFRVSLVRMSLEQSGPSARGLRRTTAARWLDPSEKGAVNYFLGMIFCKLLASKRFDTPWLLHLDVFKEQLGARFFGGRSRPDLVGVSNSGRWISFESKGRISVPTRTDKDKAKFQAGQIQSVAGVPVTYHLAGITYFKNDMLRIYCADPQPSESGFHVNVPEISWRHYYEPALQLVTRSATATVVATPRVPEADFDLEIHPTVLSLLVEKRWGDAKQWCIEHSAELGDFRADGIKVKAGGSWRGRFSMVDYEAP
jgi:hypothetical protein